ncbi:LysR family transcriptional regulator [Cupriavidus sp. 2SB]|uniref:LysR family transcriptional regulator n=1 Tax=Cupriavidus sp. 2SB TaxID=2502199 RepID=UPI0020172633|nr:LysR family transcriptional regulator [Cupriavidus sp. 2SB]
MRTQPGVSRDLARLREELADPLFVRVRGTLEPTELARNLRGTVRQALEAVDQALEEGGGFRPSESTQVFKIGTTSAVELLLAPLLHRFLESAAPNAGAYFFPAYGDVTPVEDLETGAIDIAIGRFDHQARNITFFPLFEERRVCLVRRDHPLGDKRLELADLADMRFISTINMLGRDNDVDNMLKEHGLSKRKFPMYVSTLSLAPFAMQGSNAAITLPVRVARILADQFDLNMLELPEELPNRMYSIAWHSRWDTSLSHRWFRDAVISMLR